MLKESKCCLLAVSALAMGGLLVSGSNASAAEAPDLAREIASIKDTMRSANARLQRVEDQVNRLGGRSTPVSYDRTPRSSGTPVSGNNTGRHIVARGDTLSSISRMYGVGVDRLVAANRFDDPHRLRIGQEVVVPGIDMSPPARESREPAPAPNRRNNTGGPVGGYTVKSGDTLSSIARTYGTSAGELMSLNQLTTSSILRVGQSLQVPGATGSASRRDTPPAPAPAPSSSGRNGGNEDLGNGSGSGEVEAPEGHGYYQVEKGDTLHSISLSFGTTTRELRRLNDLKSDELRVNQYLLVPVSDESLYES